MSKPARLLIFLLLTCFSLTSQACAKEAQLWSKPVAEAFGEVKPLSITFAKGGAAIAEAADIPVRVAAYGSGFDIHVDLILVDPEAKVTRVELARAAMAAALTFYQVVQSDGYDDTRPIRASIYQTYSGSYEYNVMLASAVFNPAQNNPRDFTFPGPAWKSVSAAERACTAQELAYLQLMQLSLYDWKVHDFEGEQENFRPHITSAQDAELSEKLHIKPGAVNLEPLILKSLIP